MTTAKTERAVDPTFLVGGVDLREVAGCTCLRLRKTTRQITRLYDHALEPSGLTIGQFGVLGHLQGAYVQTGEGLAIGALADRLDMDATTLNRTLKPLAAQGLITVRRHADDGRVRVVATTELGLDKLGEATRLWRQAQDIVDGRLGLDTASTLNALLDQTAAVLRS